MVVPYFPCYNLLRCVVTCTTKIQLPTRTKMTDSENYLTMNELIKHLKVTRTSINRWINKGMPSVKLGTLRRFKVSEVENWLRNSKK